MKNIGRWLILAGSIVALSMASFLGYWWVVERQPPTMDEQREVQTEPPEDVEVTLPRDLQDEMTQEKARRDELYQQALEYHQQGRLDQAVQNYRDALAISAADHTAAESYRLLGDIYVQFNQSRRAIRLYEYAIKLEPENALYRYRLGKANEKEGNFDAAATAYDRAIELDPGGNYYLARGNLSFDRGRYEQAITFYKKGLEYSAGRERLRVNLGFAHQKLGQFDRALDAYRQARQSDLGEDLDYRLAQNMGELYMKTDTVNSAVDEFERAVNLRSTVEAYYNLGQARLRADLITGAVDALEQAREMAPSDVDILIDLGFAYQTIGNYQQAARQYERAIEQEPDNTDLYFAAARSFERLGEHRKALVYYRELTERLLPGDQLSLVWRRVGELYMKSDQPDSAAPAFRNALKLDEENDEIRYNLGLSYHRSGRLDEAVNEFRKAFELDPSDTHYQFVYGVTLYRAGFRKRARQQFLELYNREPGEHRAGYMVAYIDHTWGRLDKARDRFQGLLSNVEADRLASAIYQNLGNIYTRKKQFRRAERALKSALELREDPVTFYNLGVVFAERGNWEEANSSFRLALKNGPEDARVYAGLGLALYERGLYEEAEEKLVKALDLDPGMTRAQYDLRRVRQKMEETSS